MSKICSVEGCNRKHRSLGYCEMHYIRNRRHGSPHKEFNPKRKRPLEYKVDKNGCHICTSHATALDGYVRVERDRVTYNAHRFVYMEKHGSIPEGLVVRHKCDVRNCINIDHLELGTHKDNSQDMVIRKRQHYGEIKKNSKLTEREVLKIRDLSRQHSQRELAAMFNVGKTTIARIQNNTTWRHI